VQDHLARAKRETLQKQLEGLSEGVSLLLQAGQLEQVLPSSLGRAQSVFHQYLSTLGSAMGECRRETPYAALRPVIDSQGQFKWCCDHTPEHCA